MSRIITKEPEVFLATKLEVKNVNIAFLNVEIHKESDNKNIEVTIIGPIDEVVDINVGQVDDTAIIEGAVIGRKIPGIKTGNIVGSSVTIAGRDIVMAQNIAVNNSDRVVIAQCGGNLRRGVVIEEEKMTKITIKVPKGTAIDLSGISGHVFVGNTKGDLRVENCNNVEAGNIKKAYISSIDKDYNAITICEVSEKLVVNVVGNSQVLVDKGKVSMLIINVIGGGKVGFKGTAINAVLTANSGRIVTGTIENEPDISITNDGSIYVANWPKK